MSRYLEQQQNKPEPIDNTSASALDYVHSNIVDNTLIGASINRLFDETNYDEDTDIASYDIRKNQIRTEFEDKNKDILSNSFYQDHINKIYEDEQINPEQFRDEINKLYDSALNSKQYEDEHPYLSKVLTLGSGLIDAPVYIAGASTLEATAPLMAVKLGGSILGRTLAGSVSGVASTYLLDDISKRDIGKGEYIMSAVFGATLNNIFGRGNYKQLADTHSKAFKRATKIDEYNTKILEAKTEVEKEQIAKEFSDEAIKYVDTFASRNVEDIIYKIGEDVEKGTFDKSLFKKLRTDLYTYTTNSHSDTFAGLSKAFFNDRATVDTVKDRISLQDLKMATEDEIMEKMTLGFKKLKDNIFHIAGLPAKIKYRYNNSTDKLSDILGRVQSRRNVDDTYNDSNALQDLQKQFIDVFGQSDSEAMGSAIHSLDFIKQFSMDLHDTLKNNGHIDFQDGGIPKVDNYFHIEYADNIKTQIQQLGGSLKDFKDLILKSAINHRSKELLSEGLSGGEVGIRLNQELKDISESVENFAVNLWNNKHLDPKEAHLFKSPYYLMKSENGYIKHRLGLDRMSDIDIKGTKVRLYDFIKKDFLGTHSKYARKMSGDLALKNLTVDSVKIKINKADLGKLYGLEKKIYELTNKKKLTKADIEKLEKLKEQYQNQKEYISKQYGDEAGFNAYAKYNAMKTAIENGDEQKAMEMEIEYNDALEYSPKLDQDGLPLVRNKILDELDEKVASGEISKSKAEAEINRFDNVIKLFKGVPLNDDTHNPLHRSYKILSNLNMWRLLGMTYVSMTAEASKSLYHIAVTNGTLSLPTMKTIWSNIKRGKIDGVYGDELKTYFAVGNEMNHFISQRIYDDSYNLISGQEPKGLDKWFDVGENATEKMADFTLVLGGIKPLTAFTQNLITNDTIVKLTRLFRADELSNGQVKFLKELGISTDLLKEIQNQFNKHSEFDGLSIKALNLKKWDNNTRLLFQNLVRNFTDHTIQRGHISDKIGAVSGDTLFGETLFGKIALELKHYMVTAYVNQFGRSINKKDMYVVGMLISQATGLYLANMGKAYADYGSDSKELKKHLEPERMASTIMNQLPEASYIPILIDNIYNLGTGKRVFSQSRYNVVQSPYATLPTVDLLNKAVNLLTMPYNEATKGSISQQNVNSMFGFAPNMLGVTGLKNKIKHDLKRHNKAKVKF